MLDSILGDPAPLSIILEALCGVTRAKEQNSEVRVALAESTELLVRQDAHLLQALQIASVHDIWDGETFVGPV